MTSLEIKRHVIEQIVYEIQTDFDNSSTLNFLSSFNLEETSMLTTYYTNTNILTDEKLIDLKNHISNYIEIFVKNIIKKEKYEVENSWLQAYRNGDAHGLHVHDGLGAHSYSLIFYVQCTEQSADTLFYSPGYPYIHSPTMRVTPNKSKLLIFHGSMPHEVEENKDNQRIIFSCNFKAS